MQYIIVFLEGILTFISPCLLPMLPIYLSYFAGSGEGNRSKTLRNALGFVTGFTIVFVTLGALAGTVGRFLKEYQTVVNLISGIIVVIFGLSFLDVIHLNIFRGNSKGLKNTDMGFFSALVFGIIFAIGWTPCVGAFLGSALMLASQKGHVLEGMFMLFIYSLGLGIPFVLSAVLIDYLKNAFTWIKRNYQFINRGCGIFLVIVGIAMAFGWLNQLLSIFI